MAFLNKIAETGVKPVSARRDISSIMHRENRKKMLIVLK